MMPIWRSPSSLDDHKLRIWKSDDFLRPWTLSCFACAQYASRRYERWQDALEYAPRFTHSQLVSLAGNSEKYLV